jgi:tRNA(Ile)-lysidine synthase
MDRSAGAFVATVRSTIARRGLLKGGETVVVAVSGGPDSMAMLHALARLAPDMRLTLHVAHFDHRLRDGSSADAAYVARAAAALDLEATVRAASSNDPVPGLSPEEVARERRYAFLEEVADAAGATAIATGHTLDDQAETVLMRAIAGSGVRGLGGIPAVRGRIIRPLIDARRADARAFCKALRLRPRRDPTNDDPAFLRNAVRRDLVPIILERFNVRGVEALARLSDLARDDDALLDELASTAVAVEHEPGATGVEVAALLALHPALQRRVVRLMARLDAEHTERVLELARTGRTGQAIDLPSPLNARLEYGSLLIGRAPARPTPSEPVALDVPGTTDLPPWSMRMRSWVGAEAPSEWPDGRRSCVLDAGLAGARLVVRGPRPGDRLRPLGMARSKKLGDYFTDAKVTRGERQRAAVITDGTDIVWVVGHRIDDRFKVTERTDRYLWLEASEIEGGTR